MKKALISLAIVAFVVAGAAQPAMAQQEEDMRQTDLDPNESVEENRTSNESTLGIISPPEDEENEEAATESGQFDARLEVAINTVSTLVEIAPSEEAETGLQNALDQLREVQEETGTETPPEDSSEEEEAEPPGEDQERQSSDRGPSQNENRPGFVNRMLGGLFG